MRPRVRWWMIFVNRLILAGCPVRILRCTSGTLLGPKVGVTDLRKVPRPLVGRPMFLSIAVPMVMRIRLIGRFRLGAIQLKRYLPLP